MSQTYKVRVKVIDNHNFINHVELFEMLQPCHMSGDEAVVAEEDDRQLLPHVFHIVEAAWQSKEFKVFVRTLDDWNIEDQRQKTGESQSGGNCPRRRIEKADPSVVNSRAPIGLWRNCYDEEWLRSLKPHVRERLNIIPDDYNFSLPNYERPAEDLSDAEQDDGAMTEDEEEGENAMNADDQ